MLFNTAPCEKSTRFFRGALVEDLFDYVIIPVAICCGGCMLLVYDETATCPHPDPDLELLMR